MQKEYKFMIYIKPMVSYPEVFLQALVPEAATLRPTRYWRLAVLALRWVRLLLRGPMPVWPHNENRGVMLNNYLDTCEASLESTESVWYSISDSLCGVGQSSSNNCMHYLQEEIAKAFP